MTRLHFQKYVEPLLLLLFVLALLLMNSEIDWLENTIGGLRLFWFALAGGSLLGAALAAMFAYHHHELLSGMTGPVRRSLIFVGLTALSVGFMSVAAVSHINRRYAQEAYELTITVTDKFYGRGQAQTPRLVAELDTGAREHIWVDRPFWDRVVAGDQVRLQLTHGALGYDVVKAWSVETDADQ